MHHLHIIRHFLLHKLLVSLALSDVLLTLAKYMLEPVVCTLDARRDLNAQAVTLDVALLLGVVDCLVELACFHAVDGACAVARGASAGFSEDR